MRRAQEKSFIPNRFSSNGEIGDICAWKFKKVAGYNVQLEWSNAAGKCV